MGTYNLPRNVKGEGRILFIFSTKALIYSTIGAAIGIPIYLIFSAFKLNLVGLIFIKFLALINLMGRHQCSFQNFGDLKFSDKN